MTKWRTGRERTRQTAPASHSIEANAHGKENEANAHGKEGRSGAHSKLSVVEALVVRLKDMVRVR